jgi:hypothetical protein
VPKTEDRLSAVGGLIGKDAGGLRIVTLGRDLRQEGVTAGVAGKGNPFLP